MVISSIWGVDSVERWVARPVAWYVNARTVHMVIFGQSEGELMTTLHKYKEREGLTSHFELLSELGAYPNKMNDMNVGVEGQVIYHG